VRKRSLEVLRQVSCIVYVLDGKAGVSPHDRATVREIRTLGLPLLFAVNKIDQAVHQGRLADFAEIGAEELIPISAAHGGGIGELWERIFAALGLEPKPPVEAETSPENSWETRKAKVARKSAEKKAEKEAERKQKRSKRTGKGDSAAREEGLPPEEKGRVRNELPRIALLGRPNVGKSSLLNRIVGFDRALVDSQPGTTRDPIDVEVEWGKRRYTLIDTAGLRRRARITEDVEGYAASASLASLARCDVAVLVLDAGLGISDQELRLADLAWRRGRGLVVAVNKADLAPDLAVKQAQKVIEERLPQWPPLPVVKISAKLGTGLPELFRAIGRVAQRFSKRIATAQVNDLIEAALAQHLPPTVKGRPVKIFYATQARSAPPRVLVFANRAEDVSEAYRRYLVNFLRRAMDLEGVPLLLTVRSRRDKDSSPKRQRP
jgi:GTPase